MQATMQVQQSYGLTGEGCDVCQRAFDVGDWYVLALPTIFPQAMGLVLCARCVEAAAQCLAARPPHAV